MTDQEKKHHVCFGGIAVRTYTMTIGDNPCVSIGPPVALSWAYEEKGKQDIEEYEKLRAGRRRQGEHHLKLNYYQRIEIIQEVGLGEKEIKMAERQVFWDQTSRSFSHYLCYPQIWIGGVRASIARTKCKRKLRQLKQNPTPDNAQ